MAYTQKSQVSTVERKFLKSYLQIDPWLIAVLACFILLAYANWGKLTFPIIDIGHEVEPPFRILAGQVLYRDIHSYYGPLSYYVNALALLLFGHHINVFYAIGVSLALLVTLMFYQLAKQLMNARWAALCTTCFLIYCAIGPSIFHFIVPYSYGSVYAIALCFLAFLCLDYYSCQGRLRWLLVAAIACGFAGLAKQEYGVAALGSLLIGTNLYTRQKVTTKVWHTILVLVTVSIIVLLPLTLLAQQASWEELQKSLFPVGKSQIMIASGMFDFSIGKTVRVWWRGLKVFIGAFPIILGAVVGVSLLSRCKWFKNIPWFRKLLEVVTSIAISLACLAAIHQLPTFSYYSNIEFLQPLNDLSWTLPFITAWFAWNRPQLSCYQHASLLWTLLAFSLLLNLRWIFHIHFYGLYASTVVLLSFTILYYLSQKIHKIIWKTLLISLLIAGSINIYNSTTYRYAVNSSYGTFYTQDAVLASAFNQTLKTIKTFNPSSLLVLPQGNILNFLTATLSPSKETNFIPGIFPTIQDELDFIAKMQEKPPALIVYVDIPFYSLKPGYRTLAEVNPLIHKWIIQKHQLVDSVSINSSFPWHQGVINIYSNNF